MRMRIFRHDLKRLLLASVIALGFVGLLSNTWTFESSITSRSVGGVNTTKDYTYIGEEGINLNIDLDERGCAICPKPRKPRISILDTQSKLEKITCDIDGRKQVKCRIDEHDTYMPTKFINKYFEVFGGEIEKKRKNIYEFNHSYGKVNAPTPVYEPGGAFLNFKFYHVEVRGMLKCVTASEGVPLAVQWNKNGYFYGIAVAQFGLAHHAKGIIDGNPEPTELSNGNMSTSGWVIPPMDSTSFLSIVEDNVNGVVRKVVGFTAPVPMASDGPTFKINSQNLTLCVSIKMVGPGGITIKIRTHDGEFVYFHFAHVDTYMTVEGAHVILGMKQKNFGKWMRLTRDLNIDYQKAMGKAKAVAEVVSVTLHGKGFLDNMTISETAHNEMLMHAANWLFENQDEKGGWPTETAMRTAEIKLPAGWYSAMGQGQAMSTLIRAYNLTGDRKYLTSAEKGLYLYTLGSEEGGVRARFLGQLDWYEEYPTVPSTFVLNGFIFAMMGLYDVMKTSQGEPQILAQKLWDSGMRSLKIMLGMYDSGVGTLYDLRHVINHEPPNRARWDYHRTHIALIHEMAIVDGDRIFWETWTRWKGYLKGSKTKHN